MRLDQERVRAELRELPLRMFAFGARHARMAAVSRGLRERGGFLLHPRGERMAQAAIGVEDFPPVRMVVDDFREALAFGPGHHRPRFRFRSGRWSLVGVGTDAGAASARRAPCLRVVPVLVDADPVREDATVLSPQVVGREDVVVAVGIPDRGDPDLVRIDGAGDPLVDAVSGRQSSRGFERDDGRADLTRMMRRGDEHRRLVLVDLHIVRDAQRKDVAPFESRRRVVCGGDVDDLGDVGILVGDLLRAGR